VSRAVRSLGAALLLAALPACVTGSYDRVHLQEPVREADLASLVPGAAALGDCLQRLGAPWRVLEYDVDQDGNSGAALLWTWRDAAGWGVQAEYGDNTVSGSLAYESVAAEQPACVLWFDHRLVLQRWRFGTAGDLLPRRQRPAPFADAAEPAR
jgi:hypothetical protein